MAENANISPQVNPYGRADEEVASVAERGIRRKKRQKCFAIVAAFAVFQIGVILLIALTVMKIRTPKFSMWSGTFENFEFATLGTNSSFNIRMKVELCVKNTNFGHYRFQNSTIQFYFRDTIVGEAAVPRAGARPRSTKNFNLVVNLSSANVPSGELADELRRHAVIPLSCQSILNGDIYKPEIIKVVTKKKSIKMNCNMEICISTRQLQHVICT